MTSNNQDRVTIRKNLIDRVVAASQQSENLDKEIQELGLGSFLKKLFNEKDHPREPDGKFKDAKSGGSIGKAIKNIGPTVQIVKGKQAQALADYNAKKKVYIDQENAKNAADLKTAEAAWKKAQAAVDRDTKNQQTDDAAAARAKNPLKAFAELDMRRSDHVMAEHYAANKVSEVKSRPAPVYPVSPPR